MEKIHEAILALLNQCDGARVRDNVGFNSFDAPFARSLLDKINWTNYDQIRAWKMLKKYRVQLSSLGIDYDSIPAPAPTSIKPSFHEKWGSLIMPLNGRITKDLFAKYVDIHKQLGFRFDGVEKVWYIKKPDIANHDHVKYTEMMSEIGIIVEDIPDHNIENKVESNQSIDQVISKIRSKQLKNSVSVRHVNGKFIFHFPFNDLLVDLFSNKSGQLTGITEFNVEEKTRETCEIEVALEAIEKIKALLPDWQIVTSGVDEAIKAKEIEIEKDRIPIPEVDVELNPDYSLFHFQNEGVRHLIKTNGNALLGYDMGLGKSCISLAWAVMSKKKVLVVCPKVVRRTWIQEALKFFPAYFKGKVIELKAKDKEDTQDLNGVRLASVNYESLEKFLPKILAAGFDTIIIDESHRMKSPKAKVTKTLQSIRNSFRHRILLSGTAVKNKKVELLTQTNFIEPGLFTKHELITGTIGGCWNKLRKTIYITRTKKEVLPDLPEKITQIVELDVSGMPPMPEDIGDIMHTRIKAALAKAPATVDFVKEILDSSDSCCLVFTESREAAELIAAKLGDIAILHHGQMSDDKREAAKEEFQNDKSSKRVFVSTRQSLAVGATLTRADKVVFNDLPWNHADIAQAEARAHRIGSKSCVNVYWLTARDSDWDLRLTHIIRRKYDLTKRINEGKQITKEEQKWLSEPISLEEIKTKI
jgi:SWI/SNF-related matrix-associated actin-dependent regulator 1 of chromatin subfamily A